MLYLLERGKVPPIIYHYPHHLCPLPPLGTVFSTQISQAGYYNSAIKVGEGQGASYILPPPPPPPVPPPPLPFGAVFPTPASLSAPPINFRTRTQKRRDLRKRSSQDPPLPHAKRARTDPNPGETNYMISLLNNDSKFGSV